MVNALWSLGVNKNNICIKKRGWGVGGEPAVPVVDRNDWERRKKIISSSAVTERRYPESCGS